MNNERLKELIHYDPDTGIFTWLPRHNKSWTTRFAGKRAGYVDKYFKSNLSYLKISIDNKPYLAHRLACLYMTGRIPTDEIDHKDGNGLNNKWNNLREATHTQNRRNNKIYSNNTSGFKGVHFYKSKNLFQANIRVNDKQKHLGYFNTAEGAHNAYVSAAKKYFDEFERAE